MSTELVVVSVVNGAVKAIVCILTQHLVTCNFVHERKNQLKTHNTTHESSNTARQYLVWTCNSLDPTDCNEPFYEKIQIAAANLFHT